MGYFDALASSYFKTTPDGRRLFYPWGVLGRGYALATQEDEKRVRRQINAYTIVSFVLVVGAYAWQGPSAAIAIGAALVIFYAFFQRYLVRGLQQATERLSLRESYASQARAQSAAMLWTLAITSFVLTAICAFMLYAGVNDWPMALGGLVLFGCSSAILAWMLVLRRAPGTP